ncbi:MAG: ABC transporter ATP-binding protein [Sphingomicrobium sp.]
MTPIAIARSIAISNRLSATDLCIVPRQLVAVIGPNGGGKTSLLRAFARTEDARGTVLVEDRDLDQASKGERPRLISFMPASRDAPWPIPVSDMIELGLRAPDPGRIAELIATLELQPLADRPIDRLSTGERARVMLARALAGRARLLLLDEPLSNLDPYWVLRSLELIAAEIASSSSAALVSVHDLMLLPKFDRVLLVSGGTIIADDSPATILADKAFGDVFRITPSGPGWAISRPADPLSSP